MKNVVKAFSCLFFSIVSVTVAAQDGQPQWWNGFYVGGSYGMARIDSGAHMHVGVDDTYVVGPESDLDVPFKAGVTSPSVDYYSGEQKPSSIDLFAGYQFMQAMGGDIGVEMRVATSVPQTILHFADVSFSGAGLYGTYMTQGPVYFKGLLGIGQSTFDLDGGEYVSLNASATGISYGIALGQKIWGGAIEVMYMIYPDISLDVDERNFNDFSYDITGGGSCPSERPVAGYPVNCDATFELNQKLKFRTLTVGYVYSF
ncbi:MAG: hypothetical protein HRU20_05160 [Pseudomonadales bacterium]|nr:hypothetical protein [Pseudomonadales bacterium]